MTDNGNVVRADVTDVTGKTTLNIKSTPLNLNSTYILENQLLRPNSTTYGYLNSSTKTYRTLTVSLMVMLLLQVIHYQTMLMNQ